MKSYYAYIRVSTTRQGEEGVSLQEQKRAILEYAAKRGITVTEWLEEQVTAAKRGRPVFTRLVSQLKSKKNAGLIIHKIDCGSGLFLCRIVSAGNLGLGRPIRTRLLPEYAQRRPITENTASGIAFEVAAPRGA